MQEGHLGRFCFCSSATFTITAAATVERNEERGGGRGGGDKQFLEKYTKTAILFY